MNFSENQSIYIQITAFIKEQILLGKWEQEEKIPSVRDLAAWLQVNPNTVMRACEFLQQEGIIYNRRGIGNHLAADARERILASRRENFLQSEIPAFLKNMHLLGIGFDELEGQYKSFLKDHPKD